MCGPWRPPKNEDDVGDANAGDQAGDAQDDDDGEDAEPTGSTVPGLVVKKLFVCHEESSLTNRRKKVRGTCSIQQVEGMYMISAASLSLPERPRLHYSGTNLGNVISPVVMRTSPWTATVKTKRDMYTKKYRIPVGGQNPNNEKVKRADSDIEPAFFWDTDPRFYETLLHDYFVKNVIDLAVGAGTLMLTCVRNHVGYLGVCMSELHLQGVRAVVIDGILAAMQEEGSGLYQPRLAIAMNGESTPQIKPKPAPGSSTGKRGQPNSRAGGDNKRGSGAPAPKKRTRGVTGTADTAGTAGTGTLVAAGNDGDDEDPELSDFSFSDLDDKEAQAKTK